MSFTEVKDGFDLDPKCRPGGMEVFLVAGLSSTFPTTLNLSRGYLRTKIPFVFSPSLGRDFMEWINGAPRANPWYLHGIPAYACER